MRQLVPTLTLFLIAGCVTNAPRYREVTLVDSGNYALSRQSIDAFQAEREVESRARQYCAERRRDYQQVDEHSTYVNGAGGPMHRVTLYFQCPDAESTVANAGSTIATQPPVAEAVTVSAALAIDATVAPPGAAVSVPDSLTPATSSVSIETEPVVKPETQPVSAADPKPPFREVAVLSGGYLGITRQSLESFDADRAVWTQAERYCGEREQLVEEIDRKMSYVNGSGNNQAHRTTLYFRCQATTVNPVTEDGPVPPFQEVTALAEGQLGITRQSLEPFGSGRAVQAQAESYCAERQQHVEEIDRQLLYVNKGSNEPAHRTTLYFRCKP